MKRMPHLTATIISLIVMTMALIGFNYYAQALEQRDVNALAPLNLPQAINGSALQRAALSKSDLLPIFGSSEITLNANPYQAEKFFAAYPTGFTVFNVAKEGASSLTMAQDLAALGPALKGRRVVISITPTLFTYGDELEEYYIGNYSRLHAYELILSPYLSMRLKSAAAQRMLNHPKTLQSDPLIQFTLNHMADNSIQSQILYDMIWPLGEFQTEVMRLQDHAEVVLYIRSHHIDPNVQHISQKIDWASDFSDALTEEKMHTLSNPYGIEDSIWEDSQIRTEVLPSIPGSSDPKFLQFLQMAKEWPDFEILLDVLQELGAKPLILSRPINARFWEAVGVSEQAQSVYYVKLHAVVDPYHMTLVDYRQYADDIYFSTDKFSHTSRYGWIYVDQTLDEFFHGNLR